MDEDRICGVNAVTALFARRAGDVKRLFYADAEKERAGPFCAEMARLKRPYRLLDEADLARAANTTHHGGIVAIAEPRRIDIIDFVRPPACRCC